MKNIFVVLFMLYFLTGCNEHTTTHQETVIKYYKARDAGNYNELKILINDSITITAGDYVMPYDQIVIMKYLNGIPYLKHLMKLLHWKKKTSRLLLL